MQGRNRDANIQNGLVDTAGEGKGRQTEREVLMYTYIHTYYRVLKQIAREK